MSEAYHTGVHTATAADIKTAKFDARFPNTNQTKNCWQNYVDFHKCQKIKVRGQAGAGAPPLPWGDPDR
jgi:hypothetical protein